MTHKQIKRKSWSHLAANLLISAYTLASKAWSSSREQSHTRSQTSTFTTMRKQSKLRNQLPNSTRSSMINYTTPYWTTSTWSMINHPLPFPSSLKSYRNTNRRSLSTFLNTTRMFRCSLKTIGWDLTSTKTAKLTLKT